MNITRHPATSTFIILVIALISCSFSCTAQDTSGQSRATASEEEFQASKKEFSEVSKKLKADNNYEEYFKSIATLAGRGNIHAAAEITLLGRFDDLMDTTPDILEKWKNCDQKIYGMTTGQIYGVILANWTSRIFGKGYEDQKLLRKSFDLISKGGTSNPILLSELVWIKDDIDPEDIDGIKKYVQSATQSFAKIPTPKDKLRKVSFLRWKAGLCKNQKDYEQGIVLCDQAIGIYRELGDKNSIACMLGLKADLSSPKDNPNGSWEKALELTQLAEKELGENGNPFIMANILVIQFTCYSPKANPNGSWEKFTEVAKKTISCMGDTPNISNLKGAVFEILSKSYTSPENPAMDWDKALICAEQAVKNYELGKNISRQASALHYQALILSSSTYPKKDINKAIDLLVNVAKLSIQIQDKRLFCMANKQLGDIYSSSNSVENVNNAISFYKQCAKVSEEIKDQQLQLESLSGICYCINPDNVKTVNLTDFLSDIDKAIKIATEINRPDWQASFLYSKGLVNQPNMNPNGDWTKANSFYEKSANAYKAAGLPIGEGDAIYAQVRCYLMAKNTTELDANTQQRLNQVVALYRKGGNENRAKQVEQSIKNLSPK